MRAAHLVKVIARIGAPAEVTVVQIVPKKVEYRKRVETKKARDTGVMKALQ